MTYGGRTRGPRKPTERHSGVHVLHLKNRAQETSTSLHGPESSPKSGTKKSRFPRRMFWRDHHRELSAIVRGEVSPVMTPVGQVPMKGRRKRGGRRN